MEEDSHLLKIHYSWIFIFILGFDLPGDIQSDKMIHVISKTENNLQFWAVHLLFRADAVTIL